MGRVFEWNLLIMLILELAEVPYNFYFINPHELMIVLFTSTMLLRWWSDKYLPSLPNWATFERKIQYSIVSSCKRLLTKFQPDLTCSSVLAACEMNFFKKRK